jgi:hypothetical protein
MNSLQAGNFVGKQFDQIAFVVNDLESGMKHFGRFYGIVNWSVWRDLAIGQINKSYYGEPEDYQFSCAYAFVGDVLVELCQHDAGRSVYKDWLEARGPSLNHIGFAVDTRDAYTEVGAAFERQGTRLAMSGEFVGAGIYAYYDTVDQLGCFTEIYWAAPRTIELFERMKRGEQVQI